MSEAAILLVDKWEAVSDCWRVVRSLPIAGKLMVLQEQRNGPPLWYTHQYRILLMGGEGGACLASVAVKSLILNSWDDIERRLRAGDKCKENIEDSNEVVDEYFSQMKTLEDVLSGHKRKLQAIAVEGSVQKLIQFLTDHMHLPQSGILNLVLDPVDGQSLIHLAASHGCVEMVQYLIRTGSVSVNRCRDRNGWTALHCACHFGQWLVCEAILLPAVGAHVLACSSSGSLPMHYAARHRPTPPDRMDVTRYARVVRAMIEKGASVDARNNCGDTPLHHACSRGLVEAAEVLLGYSAQVELKNVQGMTPLLDAVASGNVELVRVLLKWGASPSAVTKEGLTAIGLAQRAKNLAMVEVLSIKESPVTPSRLSRHRRSLSMPPSQHDLMSLGIIVNDESGRDDSTMSKADETSAQEMKRLAEDEDSLTVTDVSLITPEGSSSGATSQSPSSDTCPTPLLDSIPASNDDGSRDEVQKNGEDAHRTRPWSYSSSQISVPALGEADVQSKSTPGSAREDGSNDEERKPILLMAKRAREKKSVRVESPTRTLVRNSSARSSAIYPSSSFSVISSSFVSTPNFLPSLPDDTPLYTSTPLPATGVKGSVVSVAKKGDGGVKKSGQKYARLMKSSSLWAKYFGCKLIIPGLICDGGTICSNWTVHGAAQQDAALGARLANIVQLRNKLGYSSADPLVEFAPCTVLRMCNNVAVHEVGHLFMYLQHIMFLGRPALGPGESIKADTSRQVGEAENDSAANSPVADSLFVIKTDTLSFVKLLNFDLVGGDAGGVGVSVSEAKWRRSFPYCTPDDANEVSCAVDYLFLNLRDRVQFYRTLHALRDMSERDIQLSTRNVQRHWDYQWVHSRAPAAEKKFHSYFDKYLPTDYEKLLGHSPTICIQPDDGSAQVEGHLYWSSNFLCFQYKHGIGKDNVIIPLRDIRSLRCATSGLFFHNRIKVETSVLTYTFVEKKERHAVMRSLMEAWLHSRAQANVAKVVMVGRGILSPLGIAIIRRLLLNGVAVTVVKSRALAEDSTLREYFTHLGVRYCSTDTAAQAGAFERATVIVIYSSPLESLKKTRNLMSLIKKESIKDVIYLSLAIPVPDFINGSDCSMFKAQAVCEQDFLACGKPVVSIRIGILMQHLLSASMYYRNALILPTGDLEMPWVDGEDVAEVIVRAVVDPKGVLVLEKDRVFLVAEEVLSCQDVVNLLSDRIGQHFSHDSISTSQIIFTAPTRDQSQLQPGREECIDFFDSFSDRGEVMFHLATGSDLSCLLGRTPTTFAEFFDRNRDHFDKTEFLLHFTRREAVRVLQRFDEFDLNGDGHLTLDQFAPSLGAVVEKSELYKRYFRAFDLNKDGIVSAEEFLICLGVMMKGTVSEKMCLMRSMFTEDDEAIRLHDVVQMVEDTLSCLSLCCPQENGFSFPVPVMVDAVKSILRESEEQKMPWRQFEKAFLSHESILSSFFHSSAEDGNGSCSDAMSLARSQGRRIHIWHHQWDLSHAMQLGVGVACKFQENKCRDNYPLMAHHFREEVEFELFAKPGQGLNTAVSFRDFAPRVFHEIRAACGLEPAAYFASIGCDMLIGNMILGNSSPPLQELVSSSRSGSVFFSTGDNKYILKTVAAEEEELLREILYDYWEYLRTYPDTLLTRMFGLHSIRLASGKDICFIVMENVFSSELEVQEQYDLKGSTIDRQVEVGDASDLSRITRKDLDLQRKVQIGFTRKSLLMQQIECDSKWMEKHNICDYSFLLGIHFMKAEEARPPLKVGGHRLSATEEERRGQDDQSDEGPSLQGAQELSIGECGRIFHAYKGGMLSESVPSGSRSGGSSHGHAVYFVGIIDILTQYNLKKIGEHHLKSLFHDSRLISAIPPAPYRSRFVKYMYTIID